MTQNEKLKILWIDDAFAYDLHAMMAYVDELRGSKGGFDVKEIARSDEALEILESGTDEFVCIILDIMMPYGKRITRKASDVGMSSGIILKTKIHDIDDGKYRSVPIVMLTSVRRQEKYIADYLKKNPDTCFFKGEISAEDFREKIKKLIRSKQ